MGSAHSHFLAFAIHLGLARRSGLRAWLLLATIAISALWEAVSLGFALADGQAFWTSQAIVDGLRIGGWLAFAMVLLGWQAATGRSSKARRGTTAEASSLHSRGLTSFPGRGWWAAPVLLVPAAVWLFPPDVPVSD